MPRFLFAAALFLAAVPACAQTVTVKARLGANQTVTVNAVKPVGGSPYVEIGLPQGAQRLEDIGEQFMTMKSGGRDVQLAVADLNGDGIDEIIVRGSVPPSASAILVYQWNAEQKQYLPVTFSNGQDEEKLFLFTDTDSSVSINGNTIEVTVQRTDQSGRTANVTDRYRWDGNGIRYTEDH